MGQQWTDGASVSEKPSRLIAGGELLRRSSSTISPGSGGDEGGRVRGGRLDRAVAMFSQAAAISAKSEDAATVNTALLAKARCLPSSDVTRISDGKHALDMLEKTLGSNHQ